MQYFDTLPKVIYKTGALSQVYTNLLARASMLPDFIKNSSNYYKYTVQEGDTPEIIANKYYGDSYRYWIVLFSNQITDPQWDWPLSPVLFQQYIESKYAGANPHNIMHHYEKTITQLDVNTQTKSSQTVTVDQITYENTPETTVTINATSGPVIVTVTKEFVSLYEYEYNVNESKKSIYLLNSIYVGEIEKELKKLMAP